jgi:hypothetical protein
MRRRIALIAFVMTTGWCCAAPTVEEMLAVKPKDISGPHFAYPPSHEFNFTRWRLSISGLGDRTVLTYKAFLTFDAVATSFLVSEGHFQSVIWGYEIAPKFIQTTRPDDLEGGVWEFGHDQLSETSTWTWTQNEPEPGTTPATTPSIVQKNLNTSANLSRSISRAVRGKNPRKAIPFIARQLKLLKAAQAAVL